MCGLAGVMAPNIGNDELSAFRDLMTISQLRGFEGSGVALVTGRGEILKTRTTAPAGALVHSEQFDKLVGRQKSILIGHARAPTKGGNTLDAVHPHQFDHITGVHNGTMQRVDDKLVLSSESDSALIFQSIAKNGIKEAVKGFDGAYALVWTDTKAGTLNFLRNYQRPLWLAEVYNKKERVISFFWASEKIFLEVVLRRFRPDLEGIKLIEVKPDEWMQYSLKVGSKGIGYTKVEEVKKPEVSYPTHGVWRDRGVNNRDMRYGYMYDDDGIWDADANLNTDKKDQREAPFCGNVVDDLFREKGQAPDNVTRFRGGVGAHSKDAQREKDITPRYVRTTERLPSDIPALQQRREHVRKLLEDDKKEVVNDKGEKTPLWPCCNCGTYEEQKTMVPAIGSLPTFFCSKCGNNPDWADCIHPSFRGNTPSIN